MSSYLQFHAEPGDVHAWTGNVDRVCKCRERWGSDKGLRLGHHLALAAQTKHSLPSRVLDPGQSPRQCQKNPSRHLQASHVKMNGLMRFHSC